LTIVALVLRQAEYISREMTAAQHLIITRLRHPAKTQASQARRKTQ